MGHKKSASSSSSSDSDYKKKGKKEKKDKKHKKDDKLRHDKGAPSFVPPFAPPVAHDRGAFVTPSFGYPGPAGPAAPPGYPAAPVGPAVGFPPGPAPPVAAGFPAAPAVGFPAGPAAPGAAPGPTPPAAGHRIALSTDTPFPAPASLPPTALHDVGGAAQPVYVGSAIFPAAVHPCKIAPHLAPPVRVPYGGGELEHRGRFDLLPVDAAAMEWVPAAHGRIPPGRRPIEGGYEEGGARLFHALAFAGGVWVPGKTGEHLGGAAVAFGGGEHHVAENYQILCWRY